MTVGELREALKDAANVRANGFRLLQELCALAAGREHPEETQELVLRALEWRDEFGPAREVLDALVRELGLFQYLNPAELPLADQIAYELHRPEALGDGVVFHAPQAAVYWRLVRGESVVLSAPTSFGKSLIIDAVIASGRYRNILIVVPTIALIDETRRRLTARFRDRYKVITHHSQTPGERNITIATQERVLQGELPEGLDFFVIDEFYKLSPGNDDDDRWPLLNQVFYRLAKKVKHFYLLGPNVLGISQECETQLRFHTFIERYHTVVSQLHPVGGPGDEFERLLGLCKDLTDPTIIFCRSVPRVMEVARRLSAADLGQSNEVCREAADWVAAHYHPDWHFVSALRQGIGVHHSRIPRALSQFIVRAFNDGHLRFLACTSTLIEGVNTKAKNIVIFDDRINRKQIDLFTFNNIRGRAGRMRQHFIGHVYLFHPEPAQELPLVQVPAYSQSEDAPDSLLIQLDEADLSERSKTRIGKYLSQNFVDYATLQANNGLDPERQLAMAREIAAQPRAFQRVLRWSGFPTYDQVEGVSELLWKHFEGGSLASRSVFSARQLAFKINALRSAPTVKQMIASEMVRERDPDVAVQRVLDFLRLWAEFHFPRLLRGLDRIQKDVFRRANLPAGDYEFFASKVESLFLEPEITALDEYGVPLEVARKLSTRLRGDGSLDQTLQRLRALDLDTARLAPFERRLVEDAQKHA